VSCSVHDAVRLEARGVPTAVVGTEPFLDEALEQSRLLGMPNYPLVLVAHPVQLLTDADLTALADDAFPYIEELLTDAGEQSLG
jgi:hypothetical protein